MRTTWCWVWALMMGGVALVPVDAVAQEEQEEQEQDDVEVQQEEVDATDLAGRSVGAFAGINLDASDPLLGIDARWTFELSEEVAPWFALALNPAFTWQFIDSPPGASAQGFQIDVNGLAKFAVAERVVPYVGVGLAFFFTRISPDTGTTSTDTDANVNFLVGGAKLDVDQPFDVFGQFRITNQTVGSALTIMGGISTDF